MSWKSPFLTLDELRMARNKGIEEDMADFQKQLVQAPLTLQRYMETAEDRTRKMAADDQKLAFDKEDQAIQQGKNARETADYEQKNTADALSRRVSGFVDRVGDRDPTDEERRMLLQEIEGDPETKGVKSYLDVFGELDAQRNKRKSDLNARHYRDTMGNVATKNAATNELKAKNQTQANRIKDANHNLKKFLAENKNLPAESRKKLDKGRRIIAMVGDIRTALAGGNVAPGILTGVESQVRSMLKIDRTDQRQLSIALDELNKMIANDTGGLSITATEMELVKRQLPSMYNEQQIWDVLLDAMVRSAKTQMKSDIGGLMAEPGYGYMADWVESVEAPPAFKQFDPDAEDDEVPPEGDVTPPEPRAPRQAQSVAAPKTQSKIRMTSPRGMSVEVDADKAEGLRKKGWK
jgi:hypothetical protein